MAWEALCGGGLHTISSSILYIKSGSTQQRKLVPKVIHVVDVDRFGQSGMMKESSQLQLHENETENEHENGLQEWFNGWVNGWVNGGFYRKEG